MTRFDVPIETAFTLDDCSALRGSALKNPVIYGALWVSSYPARVGDNVTFKKTFGAVFTGFYRLVSDQHDTKRHERDTNNPLLSGGCRNWVRCASQTCYSVSFWAPDLTAC